MRRALTATFAGDDNVSGDVSVLVTTDSVLRELNKQHRGIDEATDVLTFPGPEWPGAPLGDIAISIEFAERGALARGVAIHEEMGYLAIHGGLHLLGFDDQTDRDRARMVAKMNQVAEKAGLKPDSEWASQPHSVEEPLGDGNE